MPTKKDSTRKRTDRDRVLMNIAVDTAGSFCDRMERVAGGWSLRLRLGDPAPQFIPLEMAERIGMPLKNGDIVRCKTNPNHRWAISVMVEYVAYGTALLREIGGKALCNMSNEDYEVLRFMAPSRLYTGKQHQVYLWASGKAFLKRYNPAGDYFKRCGGVEFEGESTLHIWSRPHIWAGLPRKGEDGEDLYPQPRKFTLEWGSKTRLKDIVAEMLDQGFAEDFEEAPKEPREGQGGVVTFTRESLTKTLELSGIRL